MKKNMILCLFIIITLSFTGCNFGSKAPQESGSEASTVIGGADGGVPITFTDSLEREVTIAQKPERVISLSPAITEILFAVGVGDRIIGVTDFCDYPAEALDKPRVGGFKDPNVELIIEYDPDLIFVAAGIQKELVEKFEGLGIKVVALDAETVEQVLANIQLAGIAVGNVEEAHQLVEALEKRVQAVTDKVAQASHQPSVFFEVWDDPLMTAGPGSFIDDLIKLSGGKNIAYDAAERFVQFSLEVLLERNPEVYVLNDHAHTPQDIMKRAGYQGLAAVQQGRVAAIDDDLVTLPGPRVVEGLEEMARILHPDLF